jgi:hypothetical protein
MAYLGRHYCLWSFFRSGEPEYTIAVGSSAVNGIIKVNIGIFMPVP